MKWTDILSLAVGLMGSLSGAGPWGIGAMVLGLGGLGFFANRLIRQFNAGVDADDDARAGADAGETAQDLKNQADDNRDYMSEKRKEWEKNNNE